MLHDVHVTSAPSATSVSMSTAVSIVMCRQPATRAPLSGAFFAYSARSAMRPGISFSAMRIFLRPSSASVRSLILNAGNSVRVSMMVSRFLGNSELQRRSVRVGERSERDGREVGGIEPSAQLARIEAEPDVALLAEALVVVRQVIDDREVTAGPNQPRGRSDRV